MHAKPYAVQPGEYGECAYPDRLWRPEIGQPQSVADGRSATVAGPGSEGTQHRGRYEAKQIKPCCSSMRDLTDRAKVRGFSVVLADAAADPGDPWYGMPALVFRAYDEGQDDVVRIDATVPVSVEAKIALAYCPACGRKLRTIEPGGRRGRRQITRR